MLLLVCKIYGRVTHSSYSRWFVFDLSVWVWFWGQSGTLFLAFWQERWQSVGREVGWLMMTQKVSKKIVEGSTQYYLFVWIPVPSFTLERDKRYWPHFRQEWLGGEKEKRNKRNELKVQVIIYHLLGFKLEIGGICRTICFLWNPSPPSKQTVWFLFEFRRWILSTYQAPDRSWGPTPPIYQTIVYREFTVYD